MAGPRHNRRIDTLETDNLEGMRSVTMRRCTRLPSTRLRRADTLIASCGSKPAASTLQPPVATALRRDPARSRLSASVTPLDCSITGQTSHTNAPTASCDSKPATPTLQPPVAAALRRDPTGSRLFAPCIDSPLAQPPLGPRSPESRTRAQNVVHFAPNTPFSAHPAEVDCTLSTTPTTQRTTQCPSGGFATIEPP